MLKILGMIVLGAAIGIISATWLGPGLESWLESWLENFSLVGAYID